MSDAPRPVLTSKCPECGNEVRRKKGAGRPPVFCSSTCRRAAFEARRRRDPAAYEVRVVERIETVEPDLNECVRRVLASPTASKNVLKGLADVAADGTFWNDPQWQSSRTALADLLYAIHGDYRIERRGRG